MSQWLLKSGNVIATLLDGKHTVRPAVLLIMLSGRGKKEDNTEANRARRVRVGSLRRNPRSTEVESLVGLLRLYLRH